jgi:hypothetical protein
MPLWSTSLTFSAVLFQVNGPPSLLVSSSDSSSRHNKQAEAKQGRRIRDRAQALNARSRQTAAQQSATLRHPPEGIWSVTRWSCGLVVWWWGCAAQQVGSQQAVEEGSDSAAE